MTKGVGVASGESKKEVSPMNIVELHPTPYLPTCEEQEGPKLADDASTDKMTVSLDDLSPEEGLAYGLGLLTEIQYDDFIAIFDKIALTHPRFKDLVDSLMEEFTKLAWLLCDHDEALQSYHFSEINSAKKKVWNQLIDMGKQKVSVQKLCQIIFEMDHITTLKHNLIGEEEIGFFIYRYTEALIMSTFVEEDLKVFLEEVDKTDKFFVYACNTRKKLRHMTDGERIHLKKEFLFSTCQNVVETLRAEATNKISIDMLYSLDNEELWNLLPTAFRSNEMYDITAAKTLDDLLSIKIDQFIAYRQTKAERQGGFAVGGLVILADLEGIIVADDVKDLVKVANVIRRLEHHRFIRQHHFIQAFKEMGFDHCFSKPTVNVPETGTADRPPFHVYATSVALVKHLGGDTMNLEHLAFSVIHAKSMSPSGDEVAKMGESFKRIFHSTDTVHRVEQLRECIWEPIEVFDSNDMEHDKEIRASE